MVVLHPVVVCDTPPPSPAPLYALPTTGVNHVRISGYDRHGCCCGRLARWQCAAPAVPARAEWVALHAHHVRVAQFGVRQPCCRASRAHDPARGGAVPRMVIARTNSCISFPFRTPARIPLPARIGVVWRAAAMLPRQPCSPSGAWHTVPHPGHGGTGCARADHRVGQACMRYLRVDVLLYQVRACTPSATVST